MTKIVIFCIAALSFSLTSCQTTGDPAAGGFFGWSEHKSNQRISERQMVLDELRADTARQNARARSY